MGAKAIDVLNAQGWAYQDYGQGRELRALVDDLDDAQLELEVMRSRLQDAIAQIERVSHVLAAVAAERRRATRPGGRRNVRRT